ncbi:MAG: FAD-dependent oxidoreductase [Deltaproteobacteria bacterium]|nr:FAD-dependent oxidoreductase [Deltaproteobacteria bacterium]MBW2041962.1 FAD-dependent oxidoreductase [Deltaproteobacteria bacterium]MBW2132876.1 FAD-dependent oxidoreductase [Deltaproteobacteria bacterium]
MNTNSKAAEKVVVLGAGISGLSVAWLLSKRGLTPTIIEAEAHTGGLSRTFHWHGIPCDIAPHRLHTHNETILQLLKGLLPLREHRRNSRILMAGKTILDPINPIELCLRFPPKVTMGLVKGFLTRPKLNPSSFKSLALSRYGRGLYDFFFEPYTKKMFGVPPECISVIWGQEKLRASGLFDVLKRNSKTFFRTFFYPESGGYGAIAETMEKEVKGEIQLGSKVVGLALNGNRIESVDIQRGDQAVRVACDRVFSTLPATVLAALFGQRLNLRFRKIQLVYLHILKNRVMPYHWVYFGDGDVVINRMAEFKNFHPGEGPEGSTVLCAEVTADTQTPVEDVLGALHRYRLVRKEQIDEILVLKETYAYPVYDRGFEEERTKADAFFSRFTNLHRVGRNAEFRHIELDEDLESALEIVRNIYGDVA